MQCVSASILEYRSSDGRRLFVRRLPTAQDQNEQEPSTKEFPGKGMPPRAAATEYQSQGKAGAVTIGAEFDGPLRPHARAYLFVGRLHRGGGWALWRRRTRTPRYRATIFRCAINGKKTLLAQRAVRAGFQIPQRSRVAAARGVGGEGVEKQPHHRWRGSVAATSFRPSLPKCPSRCAAPWNSTFKRPRCRRATVPCPRPACCSSITAARPRASSPGAGLQRRCGQSDADAATVNG